MELVFKKLYKNFILEIDAIDNGVNVAESPLYFIRTCLSDRIAMLNTPWNAPADLYNQNSQFKKAMKVAEEDFFSQLYAIVMIMMPARKIVQEAWEVRHEFHHSGEFIYFEKTCPWKEHLLDIERETNNQGHIKFAFYKDGREMWRLQALPATVGKFGNRVSIAKEFCGLRGEELSQVAGVPDAEFVHAAGFVGGAWSRDSVIKMALYSVQKHNENGELHQNDLEKKQKTGE